MNQSLQSRQPRGIPVGGQFSTSAKGEAGLSLRGTAARAVSLVSTAAMDKFFGDANRHQSLIEGGYVPATVLPAMTDPRNTRGRDMWWAQAFVAAEHKDGDDSYPVIPDNYTPSKRSGKDIGGRSEEGDLRTYRTKWTDDGVTFRMPSKNSINAFASEVGGTFRAPFSAVDEKTGRTIETEVLITNHGGGAWSVDCASLSGASKAMVTEAITARLEHRRVAKPVKTVGSVIDSARNADGTARSLLVRAASREASLGAPVVATKHKSQWVSAVGYNAASGVMFTETSNGNTYGHHVKPEVFETVRGNKSPGAAFNALVKGKPRAAVERCGSCESMYATANGHACAKSKTEPTAGPKHSNSVARAAAAAVAANVAPRVARRQPVA